MTSRPNLLGLHAVAAVLARPSLWPEALRACRRLAGQRGASEPKIVPLDYLRFRAETASGGREAKISGEEIVDWLKWAGRFRRVVE